MLLLPDDGGRQCPLFLKEEDRRTEGKRQEMPVFSPRRKTVRQRRGGGKEREGEEEYFPPATKCLIPKWWCMLLFCVFYHSPSLFY